jgi:DNA-binding IclR family transcriptional regulator
MTQRAIKNRPSYAVASVDNALRLASMLQLEGVMSVSDVAQRLGVAKSTAHRLLTMLVYRDFAVQDDDRHYRAGPVLELAAQSPSFNSALRAAALPHLRRLVELTRESANLAIRTGDTVRFLACVEADQVLRVGSREGMVFPAHRTTIGMLALAELSHDELATTYGLSADPAVSRQSFADLERDLAAVKRSGFALNEGRSERGVVAVGVPVVGQEGQPVAGLSVAMPSVRYDSSRLPQLVATLRAASAGISADMGAVQR